MARTKKSESVPVRIRFKELENGNKSIYLDIYYERKRRYEFLKLLEKPRDFDPLGQTGFAHLWLQYDCPL